MKPSEAARSVSRALAVAGNVTGHGVAPLGNNTRPCLKPSETARERSRALAVAGNVTGHGVAPFGNNRRPCCASGAAGG
ncbi:MAG: hypothetical protein LBD24_00800 [Spirochaetaceae bacterium]|nr:hypothetical protein [Spirochaetaceae bacterium]